MESPELFAVDEDNESEASEASEVPFIDFDPNTLAFDSDLLLQDFSQDQMPQVEVHNWTYDMYKEQHKHMKRKFAQANNDGSKTFATVLVSVTNCGFLQSGFPFGFGENGELIEEPIWLKTQAFWDAFEYIDVIKAIAVGREMTPSSNMPHYHVALTFDKAKSKVTKLQFVKAVFERFIFKSTAKIDLQSSEKEQVRVLGLCMAMYQYCCKEDQDAFFYKMSAEQVKLAKEGKMDPPGKPSKRKLVEIAYTDVIDKVRTAEQVTLQARTRAEFIERHNLAELEQLHRTSALMTSNITDRFNMIDSKKVYPASCFTAVQIKFMKLLAYMIKNFNKLEQRQLNIAVLGPSSIGKSTIMQALVLLKTTTSVFIGNDNNSQFPLSGLYKSDFLFWDEFASYMPVNTFKEITASIECNCNVKNGFVMKTWKTINVFISNSLALYPQETQPHREAVAQRFVLPAFATPGFMPSSALLNVHDVDPELPTGNKLDPLLIAATIRHMMNFIPEMITQDYIVGEDSNDIVFA